MQSSFRSIRFLYYFLDFFFFGRFQRNFFSSIFTILPMSLSLTMRNRMKLTRCLPLFFSLSNPNRPLAIVSHAIIDCVYRRLFIFVTISWNAICCRHSRAHSHKHLKITSISVFVFSVSFRDAQIPWNIKISN